VRRDVATLVVGVDGDVKTEELDELGLVLEAEKLGKVVGVILVGLNGGELAVTVNITVDTTSNVRKLSDTIKRLSKR
jgi:hypothetical protein